MPSLYHQHWCCPVLMVHQMRCHSLSLAEGRRRLLTLLFHRKSREFEMWKLLHWFLCKLLFKVLLYQKKGSTDKRGKTPIIVHITLNNSMAQFSCKLSCTTNLWNPRSCWSVMWTSPPKAYRKVGKITLKCDYLLNIRMFWVFFQKKSLTLYQEQ